MKIKIYLLLSFFCAFRLESYEWNQLSEIGLVKKTVMVKSNKPDKDLLFSDLEIKSQLLTKTEEDRKFPKLRNPQRILIMGDTGCRLKDSVIGSEFQNCKNEKAWPFWKLVDAAEKENPDLIIHLGDYHYRENCKTGVDCTKFTSEIGYGWKPWELDFFAPMQKLFDRAPIIIVRGNHEDCKRAYLGYKLLIANNEWKKECEEYEPAQILTFKDFAIVNFDSSSISDLPNLKGETEWVKRLDDISAKLTNLGVKNVFLVTHKPIYGIIPFRSMLFPGNTNFKNYFEKSLLRKQIAAVFSGHIHISMVVTPNQYAKQLIIGNSGTKLDQSKFSVTALHLKSFDYKSVEGQNRGFGYGLLVQNKNLKWELLLKDTRGQEYFKSIL